MLDEHNLRMDWSDSDRQKRRTGFYWECFVWIGVTVTVTGKRGELGSIGDVLYRVDLVIVARNSPKASNAFVCFHRNDQVDKILVPNIWYRCS